MSFTQVKPAHIKFQVKNDGTFIARIKGDRGTQVPYPAIGSIAINVVPSYFNFRPFRIFDEKEQRSIFQYWQTTQIESAKKFLDFAQQPKIKYIDVDDKVELALSRFNDVQEDSKAIDADLDMPDNQMGWELYGYQKAGAKYILTAFNTYKRGCLLADEMGLGKTAQALAVAQKQKDVKRILIVCPSIVKYNWVREVKTWMNNKDPRWTTESSLHPDGYKLKKYLITVMGEPGSSLRTSPVTIISYDMVRSRRKDFRGVHFDMVIGDEIQAIKNRTSARSKAFVEIFRDVKYRLALTGTPADKVSQMYPILKWLHPNEFYSSTNFIQKYQRTGIKGAKMLARHLRSSCIMVARKVLDVAPDMPPLIKSIAYLEPDKDTLNLLRKQKNKVSIDVRRRMDEEVNRFYRMEQASKRAVRDADKKDKAKVADEYRRKLNVLASQIDIKLGIPLEQISSERRDIGVSKIPFAKEWIKDTLDQKDCMIVFYHHREVCAALESWMSETGITYVRVDGSMGAKEKEEARVAFNDSDDIQVFLGSIQSVNAGMNLQRATFSLSIEPDWNGSINNQAAKRMHRHGQHFPCQFKTLMYKDSLDERMVQIGAIKEANIDIFMD